MVAPIGFVCDNMEIVHDLDVEAAAAAAGVVPLVPGRHRDHGPGFVEHGPPALEERRARGRATGRPGGDGLARQVPGRPLSP